MKDKVSYPLLPIHCPMSLFCIQAKHEEALVIMQECYVVSGNLEQPPVHDHPGRLGVAEDQWLEGHCCLSFDTHQVHFACQYALEKSSTLLCHL